MLILSMTLLRWAKAVTDYSSARQVQTTQMISSHGSLHAKATAVCTASAEVITAFGTCVELAPEQSAWDLTKVSKRFEEQRSMP